MLENHILKKCNRPPVLAPSIAMVRPVVENAMLDVESDGELYTLQELHTRMTGRMKRLKQKLIDDYKDSIFFAEIDGRSNVVFPQYG